jgi:hypothetical protein
MAEVSKYAIKEKKKINILEWLNNNISLTDSFKEFSTHITLGNDPISLIFNNTYNSRITIICFNNITFNNLRTFFKFILKI